jgi:hypothetical protein
MQELCWLSLLDTNITPIQNNQMQLRAALHSALFIYTTIAIGGSDKNKQLTITYKANATGIPQ